ARVLRPRPVEDDGVQEVDGDRDEREDDEDVDVPRELAPLDRLHPPGELGEVAEEDGPLPAEEADPAEALAHDGARCEPRDDVLPEAEEEAAQEAVRDG